MFSQRQLLSTDFFFKCFALFFCWLSSTCTRRNHIKMHHCAVQCSGCWLVCSTVILLAVTCCCKNPIASQSAQPFLETLKGRKGGAEKNLPPLYTYYVCILKMLILRSVYFVSSCIFASKITFLY